MVTLDALRYGAMRCHAASRGRIAQRSHTALWLDVSLLNLPRVKYSTRTVASSRVLSWRHPLVKLLTDPYSPGFTAGTSSNGF